MRLENRNERKDDETTESEGQRTRKGIAQRAQQKRAQQNREGSPTFADIVYHGRTDAVTERAVGES
jgi:hypothetical protein